VEATWVLTSVLALAAAYVLTASPHELVHAIVAALFELEPVWHGDRVSHLPGTAAQNAAIAAAGPIYSLVSGALVLGVSTRVHGYPGLACFWFGMLGVAGVCGYLISGPFSAVGAVLDVLRLLPVPVWLGWSGAVLGAAGLTVVARIAVNRLVDLSPLRGSATTTVLHLGVLAVPPAAVLVLAAGVPAGPPLFAQTIVLLVTLLVGLGTHQLRDPPAPTGRARVGVPPQLTAPILILLMLATLEWLVLRPGVPL
jgi:hypothetical protein